MRVWHGVLCSISGASLVAFGASTFSARAPNGYSFPCMAGGLLVVVAGIVLIGVWAFRSGK